MLVATRWSHHAGKRHYWPDDRPVPSGEKVAAVLVAIVGALGLVVGVLTI